jgi:hypothetical protein
MIDTIVKSIPTEEPAQSLPVEGGDDTVGNYDKPDNTPTDRGDGTILEILEVGNNIDNLPQESQENIREIEGYVYDALNKRGVAPTAANIEGELTKLRVDMGLDTNATPEAVIDRIGGVVKAWKGLSFIKDASEKKQIFFKLANAQSSKAMNEIVFKAMENYQVWV